MPVVRRLSDPASQSSTPDDNRPATVAAHNSRVFRSEDEIPDPDDPNQSVQGKEGNMPQNEDMHREKMPLLSLPAPSGRRWTWHGSKLGLLYIQTPSVLLVRTVKSLILISKVRVRVLPCLGNWLRGTDRF